MVIFSKTKKIKTYLNNKLVESRTPFDSLLEEYLSDSLKNKLFEMGFNKIDIHIDWLEKYKCIGIQAKYGECYVDCQIFEDEFTLSFDLDEADDDDEYLLKSKEYFYEVLNNYCQNNKQ